MNIKKYIIYIIIVYLLVPLNVYAYNKIEYYDFASIMYQKGYDIELDNLQVVSNGTELMDKYYFYSFSVDSDSLEYMNYLVTDLEESEDNTVDYVKMDGYSFFHAEWMSLNLKMYKYCFESSGNVICGFGSYDNKDKIKNNVDDLFRDDLSEVYSLDTVHEKVKDMNIDDLRGVLDKIGVFGGDESRTSDDNVENVSKDEKNRVSIGIIYFGIGILVVSILFGMIGVILIRGDKKTS